MLVSYHFLCISIIIYNQFNPVLGCDASTTNLSFKCPLHKHETPIGHFDNSDLSLAVRSLPPEVELCASCIPAEGYGVRAKRTIPVGAWIGPYEGKYLKPEDLAPLADTSYMWEVGFVVRMTRSLLTSHRRPKSSQLPYSQQHEGSRRTVQKRKLTVCVNIEKTPVLASRNLGFHCLPFFPSLDLQGR